MTEKRYICTIPDSVEMTRDYFLELLRKYRHYRDLSFGFSKKHTGEIMDYRKRHGVKEESTIPNNLYNLPVEWNTDITYVK